MVSEEDLKTILYVPAVRAKYPWLEAAASNSEAYMQMGGMLSGGGSGKENTGVGGGKIPDVIASSTSLGTAKQVDAATLTLSFAPDGSGWDFTVLYRLNFQTMTVFHSARFRPMDGRIQKPTRRSYLKIQIQNRRKP